ncbi:MAG: TetR/AcrR family transcriptional regulator [Actinomycetota bacterium]|nr:TetR/AcrR family transcriptional regulator [Actinomycetota bacterium]
MTDAIADAARRLLTERGYANVTLDGVAAEAGVARATIYRRYRDKADLLTSVIAADCTELSVRPDTDPREELVTFLREFDDRFSESCLEVIGGILGAHGDPQALALHRQRVIAPRLAFARELLLRAWHRGQLDTDSDLDVDLALDMLVGAVFARKVFGTAADPQWTERAVDAVLTGVSKHGPPIPSRSRPFPGDEPVQ